MTPRELVKVKELEWDSEFDPFMTATTIGSSRHYYWIGYGVVSKVYTFGLHAYGASFEGTAETLAEARAACQAHYENSIYEQLIPILSSTEAMP